MITFIGKYLPDLAARTRAMRQLTVKNVIFKWGKDQEEEFQQIKAQLAEVQCFSFYDPKDETMVITDASPHGLGGILAQVKNDELRPI